MDLGRVTDPDDNLAKRWLPDINTFSLYLISRRKERAAKRAGYKYLFKDTMNGEGNVTHFDKKKCKNHFIACADKCFNKNLAVVPFQTPNSSQSPFNVTASIASFRFLL